MNELDFEMLADLVRTPGLPGRESEVARRIRTNLPGAPWELHTDNLGNLVTHLPGKGHRVLFMAHMDEVGLVVRRITEKGYLLVERLGGMSVRALAGSQLDLWTERGCIPALVGLLPAHLDDHRTMALKDIYLDIGAASRSEAESMGVRIGDGLTWSSPLARIGQQLITGKALDDRLGCVVLITLAQILGNQEFDHDLYFAFVVQEESGLMGGVPVVNDIAPEFVIGVDGTLAFDTPDLLDQQSEICLGAGPAIKLMDAIRGKTGSYLPDWELAERIRELANEQNIPLQVEVTTGLSTALSHVPFALTGIRTAALSIPIRYHHTPIETADMRDLTQMIDLLLAILERLIIEPKK